MSHLTDTGDTIVEVLIAISIAGLVLFAAYQSTSHSTRAIQDVQERGQALKLAQDQLEFLRAAGTFDVGAAKCFNPTSGAPAAASVCNDIRPNGTNAVQYKIAIGLTGISNYDVTINWDNLVGSKSNVTLYYHPPGTP